MTLAEIEHHRQDGCDECCTCCGECYGDNGAETCNKTCRHAEENADDAPMIEASYDCDSCRTRGHVSVTTQDEVKTKLEELHSINAPNCWLLTKLRSLR